MKPIVDAIAALFSSRKFLILVLTVAVLAPLVWTGKLTLEQFGSWLTQLSTVMMAGIAVEGAAEKWNAPPPAARMPADSLRPPSMGASSGNTGSSSSGAAGLAILFAIGAFAAGHAMLYGCTPSQGQQAVTAAPDCARCVVETIPLLRRGDAGDAGDAGADQ